jgi:magnesium transporter
MLWQLKSRSKKIGLPPGSLIHIGEQKTEKVELTAITYDASKFQQKKLEKANEIYQYREIPGVVWINIDGLHQTEIMEEIGKCFGIHHLVLEDILNTDHRPKIEENNNYIYVVLKMLAFDNKSSQILSEQVSLILGNNFVLSFQEGKKGDVFDPIRDRIKLDTSQIRKSGPDYLAYALLDIVIDNYFTVMEKLGEKIDSIEDDLVVHPDSKTLQDIHNLKKELLYLRKSVWPLREEIYGMERTESKLISQTTRVYLRDIYDHVIQIIDTIETFRDTVAGMLDIYLSSVSNRLNSVMKVLTIIATIFMPLTFIAGVYGMNFKYMPELEWEWGYPAIWSFMLAVAIGMLLYFWRRKWL